MGKFKISQTPPSKDLYIYPEANGCFMGCFSHGAVGNWNCVDDLFDAFTPDDDYVFMADPSIVSDLYIMQNHGSVIGTVNYVKGIVRAKSDKFPPHSDGSYKVLISKGKEAATPILTLRPNADGAFSQWIPSHGGGHWTCVDEVICDNGATHIREGTNGDKDYFGLPNHTIELGTITKVEVFACCGNGDAGVKLVIYDTSSTNRQTFSVSWLMGDGYIMKSHVFATNPDGGSWTWGDIDDLQIGVEKESGTFPYISQMYVEITYEEGFTCTEFALSDKVPLCTGFVDFGKAWKLNPFTSAAWTWDDVDAIELGFECSSPLVTVSPFVILPTGDGDRTDITDVTLGWTHWEAVNAERPLTQVEESGAAWQYDLYKFIQAKVDGTTYSSACRGCLLHNGYMFSCNTGDGVYVHKLVDSHYEYVYDVLDGDWTSLPQEIETDGTYYYVVAAALMLVYTFDTTTETLKLVCEDYDIITSNTAIWETYHDGYLYVGDASNLRVFSFNGTSFTEVDSYTVNGHVMGLLHDGNYLYVSTANGFIYAFSFDGSSLTFIDSDNPVGVDMGDMSTDGDYIYVTVQTDSIYAYSFDGTTLTYINKLEAGVSHNSVLCYNDHVLTCRSVIGTYDLNAYKFNGVVFSPVLATYHIGVPGAESSWDMSLQEGYINLVWGAPVSVGFNGTDFIEVAAVEDDSTPNYIDDNVESVTVIAKMGKEYDADDEADIRGCFIIKTGGNEFNSSAEYKKLEYPKRWYAHTWLENPDTTAPWTLAEVQALQAGIGLYGDDSKYGACSVCQLLLETTTQVSPEVQTSQALLKVNYTPPTVNCSLPKPEEVTSAHDRVVEILNFWSGSREVFDEKRSSKPTVLTGKVFDRAIYDDTWCDDDYEYRKKVTVDSAQVGGDLTNFPLLVEVDLSKHCKNENGYDIYFCDIDCNTLEFEIEHYNKTSGVLTAWVKIPTLSSSVDDNIWIYYSKDGVSVNPSTTAVWDDAGYSTVFHMTDENVARDTIKDATDAAIVGAKGGANEPTEVNAQIYKGQRGDGINDVIEIPDHADLNMQQGNFTFSLWMKSPAVQSGARDIICKHKDAGTAWFLLRQGTTGVSDRIWFYNYQDVPNHHRLLTTSTCDDTWHLYHFVVDYSQAGDDRLKAYIDGVFDRNADVFVGNPNITSVDNVRMFRGTLSGTSGYWKGTIDELRWAKGTVLSVDWMTAEHANQKPASTFLTYGLEEQLGVTHIEACASLQCIRDLAENGTAIAVSGLNLDVFNGTYRIKSFGKRHIQETPDMYEWMLELEDAT